MAKGILERYSSLTDSDISCFWAWSPGSVYELRTMHIYPIAVDRNSIFMIVLCTNFIQHQSGLRLL
jgi:hypothetical protein